MIADTAKPSPLPQRKDSSAEREKQEQRVVTAPAEVHGAAQSETTFSQLFRKFSGYEIRHFHSFGNFTNWLNRPVSGSALGVFRMLYGAAMLIDLAEERGGGQLDVRFGEPQHCHFPLIHGMQAASYPWMGTIYLCMWLGAWGIMLGYRFRFSCMAYIVPYWYIFLLDKPAWNNHSYLFGLVGSMLLFSQANRYCSLDMHFGAALPTTVPYWNYFIIKFQFFVLYTYAGLKKFTAEWLSGYAMSTLSQHWLFVPFRFVLSPDMIDLLIVHWLTAIFDFCIAFCMTNEGTRLLSLPFMLSFHLMNSRLFVIGMFPWVCLAEVPLFFSFDWPKKITWHRLLCNRKQTSEPPTQAECIANPGPNVAPSEEQQSNNECTDADSVPNRGCAKLRTTFILLYCVLQLFLPYSHFITRGYNNWTEGLYGYSWNMMLHSYDTILTSVKVIDNQSGQVHHLHPYAFTEYDRWTKYADMAQQYAHCIYNNIKTDHALDSTRSPLSSTNISIYFDVWCSMNGRLQQRVFDPRIDLLTADWSPFRRTTWSLPLLSELNHMRPKLRTIAAEVLNWNNYSDVIFVADFPGLTLENYIAADLTNVTLTILEGNVRYKSATEQESYFLTAGKSIALRAGSMHHVTTLGTRPSSYLYTYVNATMLAQQLVHDEDLKAAGAVKRKPMLPLWQEFKQRVSNYRQFLWHMGNCVLYLLYGVPIPLTVRERD